MPLTTHIGDTVLVRPGFGAMGLSQFYGKPPPREEGQAVLRKALEIGCSLWNTADVYGAGHNEELIGSVLAEGDTRSKVFLVTKWGFKRDDGKDLGFDGSKENAARSIDASIKRLGCRPDAWLVHRVDKQVPIEETMLAMEEARKAGKTRYIGISECSATNLRRASKVGKVDFIEVEYSPWTLDHEENGLLDAAQELGVIVLAYSPLGRGFLTGAYKSYEEFQQDGDARANMPRFSKENFDHNLALVGQFEKFAARKGCTAGQLTLAWLMAQGPNIIPIPGTKKEKYLVENFASAEVKLDETELKELRELISGNRPKGARGPEGMLKMHDRE